MEAAFVAVSTRRRLLNFVYRLIHFVLLVFYVGGPAVYTITISQTFVWAKLTGLM
jgi:hypothetical protein